MYIPAISCRGRLLAAALCVLAFPLYAAEPVPVATAAVEPSVTPATMDAAAGIPALDAASVDWREQVLPSIRSFLDAERTALEAMAAECRQETDPERLRDLQTRIELRKLGSERHLLVAQRDWARKHQRTALDVRITAVLQDLDAAHPELAAAATAAPAAPVASPH